MDIALLIFFLPSNYIVHNEWVNLYCCGILKWPLHKSGLFSRPAQIYLKLLLHNQRKQRNIFSTPSGCDHWSMPETSLSVPQSNSSRPLMVATSVSSAPSGSDHWSVPETVVPGQTTESATTPAVISS